MKKLFCVFVCILLVTTIAATAAAAASAEMTISASQTKVMRGETVGFAVTLSSLEDCRAAGLVLNYDRNAFEFVGGKCTLSDAIMADFSDETGVFAFEAGTAVSGEIFTFQLKVKKDAALGEYSVSAKGNVRTSEGAIPTTINTLTVCVGGSDEKKPDPEKETTATTTPTDTVPAETVVETQHDVTTAPTGETADTTVTAPAEKTGPLNTQPKKFQWWIPVACGLVALGSLAYIVRKKKK